MTDSIHLPKWVSTHSFRYLPARRRSSFPVSGNISLMNNRPLSVFYIYQSSHTSVCFHCSRIYERATSTDFSKHQPCLCLCFGFSQITLILPFLLMILHFSQIGLTDDLTFTVKSSFHRILSGGRRPQNHAYTLYQRHAVNASKICKNITYPSR